MIAVILYGKFSPFHNARLEAAGSLGQKRKAHLIGVEVASTQGDYSWPESLGRGISYQRVTLFSSRDYWTLSYKDVRHVLHQILSDLKPDVVVLPGWGFKESLAGLGWCLRRKVPRVVISDSQRTDGPQTIGKLWLKRFLVRRFQAGFVGGRSHVRYLKELGLPEERCFVGCDVVDNDFFARESQQERGSRSRPKEKACLLSCLRLLPRKNVRGVLDMLVGQAEHWSWMIAGDGPERPQIERRIKALGLESRVRLLGHVNYFQLPRLYAQADAYLQPSLSEPWGLAVNEAMACGLPVVVSDRCGCHGDLVQEGVNGFTFDPAYAESLAIALDRLWSSRDRWEEMGRASRKIIDQWGLDLFARNFWQAFETALRPIPEGPIARAVSKALGLAL